MKRSIKKEAVLRLFGGPTRTAEAFGITQGAVSQWPDGKLIPLARELELRYVIKPEGLNLKG